MSARRRSTRICATRKPVEVITISSSDDDDEIVPLPRQTAILQDYLDESSDQTATPSPVPQVQQPDRDLQHQHQQQQHQHQHQQPQRLHRPIPPIPTHHLITPSPTPPPPPGRNTTIERSKRRKLMLDKIIGAVNSNGEFLFVVRWKGLDNMERIAMRDLAAMFPSHVLDFMFQRIKWSNDTAPIPPPTPTSREMPAPQSEPVARTEPVIETRAATLSTSSGENSSDNSNDGSFSLAS